MISLSQRQSIMFPVRVVVHRFTNQSLRIKIVNAVIEDINTGWKAVMQWLVGRLFWV